MCSNPAMATDADQPGLRLRVAQEARRISSQHRQLDVFYGMVLTALEAGAPERARAEFLRFHDALDAHFTMEDRIHFPALHGLRPELDAELQDLVEEHNHFREELDTMARLLEARDLAGCGNRLDGFVTRLAAHEGREERMGRHVIGRPGGTG
jgi:hypothetical protein